MKNIIFTIFLLSALFLTQESVTGQKKTVSADLITAKEIESNMSFLGSPLLRGRGNGDPGLEIAQEYIVSQLRLMGIKPAAGESYFQPYTIFKTTNDPEKTMISISTENHDSTIIREPVYQLIPTGPSKFDVSGEVVFAGYGLRQDKYGYNDFADLKPEGKILLIMNGAPTSEDGKKELFEGVNWDSFMSIQVKLLSLMTSKAKAVIIVMGPKSGVTSFEQKYPGISGELASSKSLKKITTENPMMANMPKILFADRKVADEILKGTGFTLENLQKKIDSEVKPYTFSIPGKSVRITEDKKQEEIILRNVAAVIEGSDPVLRDEYVVFSGHLDHVGASGEVVNAGADDNASGSAGLLSIAKAFQNLGKKPLRSLLFLWVSGEEIGLFGSQSYINNPLVPIEKTVADLNMDMIGRVKSAADTTSETPMTDKNKVFVITCNQSKELVAIADEIDKTTVLDLDYSLSGKNHPLQLFQRSDHFNFVRKDIPVLFFSSGLHTDYHTPGDVLGKIDYPKMALISNAVYQIGYNVANRKARIVVDNPYSKW